MKRKTRLTITIKKEDRRIRPRAGVKASRVHRTAKTYKRRPKHPERNES